MGRVPADDWRRQGQERYLLGASFKRMAWSTTDPQWDHDHCEFCTRKLALAEIPDSLQEGYGTPNLQHWVCPECFEDFREEFGWIELPKS
jgi:hypothetical protein